MIASRPDPVRVVTRSARPYHRSPRRSTPDDPRRSTMIGAPPDQGIKPLWRPGFDELIGSERTRILD
jgi:hypothetical protein